jgi:uncharacterized protein (TIGR02145 family)
MKKLLLPLAAILVLSACQKQVDIDSNTGTIGSVTICNQTWTDKNLDLSTYRNGDTIPQVTDQLKWANLKTGAWCYYNNDTANGRIYGKLYNWYAVTDPRGLAPKGWHIPSVAEWETLMNCLGGEFLAGGKMKETGTVHWLSPNDGANNSSKFTALPAGWRESDKFNYINGITRWWSTTEVDDGGLTEPGVAAVAVQTDYISPYFGVGGASAKYTGYSVRCVKD